MRASVVPAAPLAAILLAIAPLDASSQEPQAGQPAVPAQRAPVVATGPVPHAAMPSASVARRNGDIAIDGRMNESAWDAAAPITSFTQVDPQEGQPASERTEARILVDDDAIYVGMRLYDSNPRGVQTQLARRDEGIDGDLVELYLDSYHDHLNAVVFRLSPAGARRDATVSSNGGQDNSWDAVWEGSATTDAEGWTAEFRIPLSQLRYDPRRAEHTWGIQLARKIARKAEVSLFAFVPKNQQSGVHTYGHLTGLGRLAAPRHLELVPYALVKTENPSVEAGDPFRKKNDVVPGVGLDLKYGITSNLTLDATINPDFGQVEVDPAVVNLSAFETFFPERRPFFVQGAGIFSFGSMRTNNSSNGYNFVHTRRIGRTPQRRIGGGDIEWVDSPLETTILGAAKLTGRSAGGWSIGVLDAVTSREQARFIDTTGGRFSETVEPLANYFVGRLKRDLRQGNTTIGIGATTVNRNLGDDADITGQFRSAAYVGGLDWNHAWGNRMWALDGNVVFTHNRGSAESITALQLSPARYYQRPDKEGYRLDETRTSLTGWVGELTFAKLSGEHWRGSVTYQEYSPGFEINEVGFNSSTDMRSIAPLIQYRDTKPGKIVREWSQYLFWNPSWNYDGDLTFNGVGAIWFGEFANFWYTELRGDWRPRVYDDRLTRGGPLMRLTEGGGVQLEVGSDRRKRYTYGVYTSYSFNEAGGWGVNVNPYATLRPASALRITLQPSYNRTHAMAQYVTAVDDPLADATYDRRYVFATLDQHQFGVVSRVDWTFTPKLSLQLFAQPLLFAGDFKDYKQLARPRTFDFDVFGEDAGAISRADDGTYTVDPDADGPAGTFTFGDRDGNQRSLRGNAVLRWEYRPGSALFLVWQQQRFGFAPTGEFGAADDFGELLRTRPENVFVVKGTWWIGR